MGYVNVLYIDHTRITPIQYYQWGFSYVQLNIVLILVMLWTIGILIMRGIAKATMKRQGRTEVAGQYKAIFELSDTMHMQLVHLEERGRDLATLTESVLRERITKGLQGGSIAYETRAPIPSEDNIYGVEVGFVPWMKRGKYWLGSLLVSLGGLGGAFSTPGGMLFLTTIFSGLSLAIVLTLCIGSTPQSRIVIFIWFFALMGLVPETIMLVSFIPIASQYGL
jgi:hypothetical protein